MTFYPGKCNENCSFCPQAKGSSSNSKFLSRVTWPIFSTKKVIAKVNQAYQNGIIKRLCIQTINFSNLYKDLISLVHYIRMQSDIPISVSCQIKNREKMIQLKKTGVDCIGIPIDTATRTLFSNIKGENVHSSLTWENQFVKLKTAIEVFGKGNVSTHLIVGLGESEMDVLHLIQSLSDLGITTALFAFTPIRGTKLEYQNQPSIESYRRIQLAKYLIEKGFIVFSSVIFDINGKILDFETRKNELIKIIKSGIPFMTSGCPNCNRPFYNERPKGPHYNHPCSLDHSEISEILKIFGLQDYI
jgi:biotin synthase